jgi:DNA-binding NarL/FixJ family response regulator
MESTEQPTALFVGNDLMFQSKIASACRSAGLALKVQRSPESFNPENYQDNLPILVIVDLGLANLDLEALLAKIRPAMPLAKWLGYGAHVLADRLEDANQLGLDAVLTRGQFDRDMVRILQSVTD